MRICIISSDYPEEGRPVYTFVKNIVDALADNGNECIVLAPFSITRNRKFHASKETYHTSQGSLVKVYRPNIYTLSSFSICGFKPSSYIFQNAINKVLDHLDVKPDAIYGHFWDNALYGYKYAKKHNIPLFVATGESVIGLNNNDRKLDDFVNYVTGVICVSTKNKDESIENKLTIPEKCVVIPNAINPYIFRKYDKQKCRKKLGISLDIFISITIGSFIHRKGTLRVSSAIDSLSDEVYSIFIGKGTDIPKCKNILFCGRVDNKDIPIYLNAADVFVLPTLHEGCCNAIVEAMACGLPIISSNLPFNRDILNEQNSILIDPNDVDKIADALKKLKNNSLLLKTLSDNALQTAKEYTLEKRAQKIENFIKSKSKKINGEQG